MKIHMTSVHEGKKTFKCKICEKKFAYKSNFITHGKSVHEGIKPVKSDICDTSFTQKEPLKKHMALVHDFKLPKGERSLKTCYA